MQNNKKMIGLLILILLVSGCQNKDLSINQTIYYQFMDDCDNEVTLTKKPKRVVSLLGSYAETWILAGGELCGVTSDALSERALNLPDTVKTIGTVKEPNVEEILSLSPEFVLLSADIESHKTISTTLKDLNIPHAFFKVEFFEDYLKMLKICTDITGNAKLYEKNGLEIQKQINEVLLNATHNKKPTVLLLRAFSTGAKAKTEDTIAGKILADLGCINIASKQKSLLDTLSMETIITEDPNYIFVVIMGESTDKALDALKNSIQRNPAWNKLTAVKKNHYIILPKELFHYKPNAKWGEAYEYLAKIIYSE